MAKLFSEFPKKSKAEWLAKVEKDLKGKPIDSLDWSPFEGLTMTPFFHPEDLLEANTPLATGRENNAWQIGELVYVSDVKSANKQALEALNGGVTALGFVFPEGKFTNNELAILLEGIEHKYISTNFYFEKETPLNFASDLHQVISKNGQSPAGINGSISSSSRGLGGGLKQWKELFPNFRLLHIRGEIFYQKEKPTNELSQILGEAKKQIEDMTEKGMSFKDIASTLQFSIAIGVNYFLAIAKIRALKLLWDNLAEGYGEENIECPFIEVHLAPTSQTYDADMNKISTTAQSMAAITGGANRLYLMPSDGFEDEGGTSFSRRIARNVQHLLQLESYLDRVADPAAGSYFIENLTNTLAERAWDAFRNRHF